MGTQNVQNFQSKSSAKASRKNATKMASKKNATKNTFKENVTKKASHHGKQESNPPSQDAAGSPPFDGSFFMGCFKDDSPKDSRLEYDALVPKEDKQRMSSSVCYEFCRSKANVEFFAMYEGRKCYCAPYLTLSKVHQEKCEEPCEGRGNEMCGGKHTVSAYEMHRDH